MKKLAAVMTILDPFNNQKFLKVYSDGEQLTYSLVDSDQRGFSISCLQTELPMFVFDFDCILDAIYAVRQAIKKSVYVEKNFKCLV